MGQSARRDAPAKAKHDPVLTRPPELLTGASPEYPAAALAGQPDADVTVLVSIDATGVVDKVTVPTPTGNGFDEAAIAAAQKYVFRPAEFDGKPGPITVQTVIHFRFHLAESQPASTQAASEPSTMASASAPASQPAAPPAVLIGSVKERGTRRKLAGVAVDIVELDREAATGADGKYRFDDVPPGDYHIVAIAPGFDKLTVEVKLASREETTADLFLRPSGGNPYETVVTGEREKLEVTRRELSSRELTTVPGTFGDPIRVLQSLPGVARAPFGLGLLIIRGSNPNESGVFIDGFEVPLLFHFLGGPSILNPEFLDSLDLYPGGFPARFGRFDGGIVEVNTKASASDGIHGAADVNLIDASVYLRAPLSDHVTFAFAARRSYIDLILPLVLPKPSNPGDTLTVAPIYWDYQARIDMDLPHGDKLTLEALGSDDTLSILSTDMDNAATFDLDTHIGFNHVILSYKTKVVGGLDMTLAGMVGRDVLNLSANENISSSVVETVAAVRQRIFGALAKTLRIDTGIDLEYRSTNYQLTIPDESDFVPATPGWSTFPPRTSTAPSIVTPSAGTSSLPGILCPSCASSRVCAPTSIFSMVTSACRSIRASSRAGRSRRTPRSRPTSASFINRRSPRSSTRSTAIPTCSSSTRSRPASASSRSSARASRSTPSCSTAIGKTSPSCPRT